MSDNPLKIIEVSTKLPESGNGKIDYYLNANYCDVMQGIWQICFLDITIIRDPKATVRVNPNFFEVSTNFVYGEFSADNSRLQVPLQKLYISDDKNNLFSASSFKWFQITSPGQHFQVQLNRYGNLSATFEKGKPPTAILTFGLKRIR